MLKIDTNSKTDLHNIIRKEVVDVMTELLSDSDVGLELSPSFERKLKKSVAEKAKGKIASLSEVLAQFAV